MAVARSLGGPLSRRTLALRWVRGVLVDFAMTNFSLFLSMRRRSELWLWSVPWQSLSLSQIPSIVVFRKCSCSDPVSRSQTDEPRRVEAASAMMCEHRLMGSAALVPIVPIVPMLVAPR